MIFEVDRQDFRTTRVVDAGPTTLAPGQVRMSIERFAFTSNNISYAVAGDMLDCATNEEPFRSAPRREYCPCAVLSWP